MKHYRRWQKWGDATKTISHEPISERIKRFTQPVGDCLIWTGGLNNGGYAITGKSGSSVSVHRTLWVEAYGEPPVGTEIDHICHNRRCVNISHLRAASKSENQQHRKGANANSSTGFRGVREQRPGRFHGEVKHMGVVTRTGTFDTRQEAAEAVRKLRLTIFTRSDMDLEDKAA